MLVRSGFAIAILAAMLFVAGAQTPTHGHLVNTGG